MTDEATFDTVIRMFVALDDNGTAYYGHTPTEAINLANTAIARRTTGPSTQSLRNQIRQAQDEFAHPDEGE